MTGSDLFSFLFGDFARLSNEPHKGSFAKQRIVED